MCFIAHYVSEEHAPLRGGYKVNAPLKYQLLLFIMSLSEQLISFYITVELSN